MQVRSIATPGQSPSTPIPSPTATATSAKARAVEAFNRAAQSQESQTTGAPPVNQNAVSVEELSAVSPPQEPQTELQDPPAEPQPDAEPKKEEQDPTLSKQFAHLARQERALRAKAQQQDQALKAREAALNAREAELVAKATPAPAPSRTVNLDDYSGDLLGLLAAAGGDYEKLTQQVISQQPPNPRVEAHIARLEAKIRQLEEHTETSKQTYADQQKASYQAAVRQIEQDAKTLVQSDPEAYEAISKTGTVRQVVKLIEDTYNKDGVLMTVEEAAQEVENYLVEENYNMANKIEKIKKRMQQTNASPKASDEKPQAPNKQPQPQPMKTLTNATSSTRKLSARERAVLAFKNELKP